MERELLLPQDLDFYRKINMGIMMKVFRSSTALFENVLKEPNDYESLLYEGDDGGLWYEDLNALLPAGMLNEMLNYARRAFPIANDVERTAMVDACIVPIWVALAYALVHRSGLKSAILHVKKLVRHINKDQACTSLQARIRWINEMPKEKIIDTFVRNKDAFYRTLNGSASFSAVSSTDYENYQRIRAIFGPALIDSMLAHLRQVFIPEGNLIEPPEMRRIMIPSWMMLLLADFEHNGDMTAADKTLNTILKNTPKAKPLPRAKSAFVPAVLHLSMLEYVNAQYLSDVYRIKNFDAVFKKMLNTSPYDFAFHHSEIEYIFDLANNPKIPDIMLKYLERTFNPNNDAAISSTIRDTLTPLWLTGIVQSLLGLGSAPIEQIERLILRIHTIGENP